MRAVEMELMTADDMLVRYLILIILIENELATRLLVGFLSFY